VHLSHLSTDLAAAAAAAGTVLGQNIWGLAPSLPSPFLHFPSPLLLPPLRSRPLKYRERESEGKEKAKGKSKGKKNEVKGKKGGRKGEGTKGREGGGREREKRGMGRESERGEFCAVVSYP